ncbi:hypothetical protein V6N11_002261 [Hibiscus sabdariffa]|uniref:Uncharacterized protein n=2 Tax=Hibiscus sabdariffa TaxID=183260 RepID=A0ABR2A7H1_9ROSI
MPIMFFLWHLSPILISLQKPFFQLSFSSSKDHPWALKLPRRIHTLASFLHKTLTTVVWDKNHFLIFFPRYLPLHPYAIKKKEFRGPFMIWPTVIAGTTPWLSMDVISIGERSSYAKIVGWVLTIMLGLVGSTVKAMVDFEVIYYAILLWLGLATEYEQVDDPERDHP